MDFYSHYRRVLTTNENFLYSFSSGLGGGTLGLFAYYLTSPLLLPFAFIPRSMLPSAISLMLAVKCGLCGLTAYIYLRDLALSQNSDNCVSPMILFFSTSYALCSYVVLNLQNAMWIDVVALFPLLVMFTQRFFDRRQRSAMPLILLVFFSLYCNYYITYMALLFLFFYALLHAGSIKHFIHWGLLCIAGAGLSAFLMLPTFLSLIGSGKNGIVYGKGLYFPALNLREILSKAYSMSFDVPQIFDGTPLIYCGVVMLFLFTMYFLNREITKKEKIQAAALCALLIISFCIPIIDIVWHALSEPEGYRYRYSFILIFLVLTCSWKSWLHRDALTKRDVLIGIAIVLLVSVYVLTGSFTHLGGTKKLANVTLLCSESFLLYLILAASKGKTEFAKLVREITPLAVIILVIIQVFDLSANFLVTYRANSLLEHHQNYYQEKLCTDGALIEEILAGDPDFYRIENADPRSENDAMLYWYNGVSVYSSETQMRQRQFLKHLGFNENTFFVAYGPHNTSLVNRLFGVRYMLREGSYTRNSYSVPVALGSGQSAEELIRIPVDDSDPFTYAQSILRVYTYAASPEGLSSEETPPDAGSGTASFPASSSDAAYDAAFSTGKRAVLVSSEVVSSDVSDDNTAITFTLRPAADGMLYFYAINLKTYEDMLFTVNGTMLTEHFGNLACTRVLDLGEFQKGDSVTVEISNIQQMIEPEDFLFVTEDLNAENRMLAPLAAQADEITRVSSSHLQIESKAGHRSLLLSIPFSEEWKVTVDGQKVQAAPLFDMYTVVELPDAGLTHLVDMQYVPAGWHAGIAISILTAAGLILYCLLRSRINQRLQGSDSGESIIVQ